MEPVGGLLKLQLAEVSKLGLDPLKTLTGRLTVMARLTGAPVPTELEAVKTTVVGPSSAVGMPLIKPLVELKFSPLGRVPIRA